MKKLLCMLLVVATVLCVFAACGKESTDPTDNSTTTTTAVAETTTDAQDDETTTAAQDDETTTAAQDDETTTAASENETTTKDSSEKTTTTTTTKPTTTEAVVDYKDKNNWAKVVNGVFTAENGGIQFSATGWKTYGLYSISMVPESYNNNGQTIAICVKAYGADDTQTFENKTKADFEEVLQANIDSFQKTKISYNGKSYTCYKAVVTNTYYVWVFQTENYKYFINFMQVEGQSNMQTIGENMMKSIKIYY